MHKVVSAKHKQIKKITEAIMKKFCESLKIGSATCCHFVVYREEDTNREWSIVVGLDDENNISGKVAYQNHNNGMATDLDLDFTMPTGKYGDVDDTQTTIWDNPFEGSPNFAKEVNYFNKEAQRIVDTYADKIEDPDEEVCLSSASKINASSNEDFICSTEGKDYSWLVQGQKKDSVERLWELESEEVSMHSSFHNLMQINFDDELPDDVLDIIDEDFRVLKKQNNKELLNKLNQLKDIFEKEGYKIVGDMGFEFGESQDMPGYVDHFCVNLSKDKSYLIICADGKFCINDYDEEPEPDGDYGIRTFEQAKKECTDLANKYKSKVESCSVYAFVDSVVERMDYKTIEAYKALNERFIDKNMKIDKEELTNSIILFIDNDQNSYKQLLNKRAKVTSICWYALSKVFNDYLEWFGCSKTSLSSEQIKNWFRANDTTYQECLKSTIKEVQTLRETYIAEQNK